MQKLTGFLRWHSASGPSVLPQRVQSVTGGSGGTEWKAQGEDSSCSDRGVVVLQRRSPTVRSQRESQSTAWHKQLPLTFLCLALPLMWAELSRCSFFLFLSHSFEVATLNSLFQRRHSCSALSHTHAHTHKLTYLAGLPLHQKLQRGGRGWGLWTLCVCVHACRQKERESDRLCSHLRLTDNSRKCCFWMHKVHNNEIRKLRQAWNFNDFYF